MTETDVTPTAEQYDADPLYVYGLVSADTELPPGLTGVDEGGVGTISHGALAAVITVLEPEDEIGTPDNLLAHSTVLDSIAEHTAVLPMAFGTIIPSETELAEVVLATREDEHLALLDSLEGAVQFTVRARYLRDEVLADLVEEDPEVARMREIIAGTTEEQTRDARIQLGERIVKAFDRIRPQHIEQIIGALEPVVVEMKERDVGQVEDVVELAVLLQRGQTQEFEDALEEVASELYTRIEFQLLGPQAPYDFVGDE